MSNEAASAAFSAWETVAGEGLNDFAEIVYDLVREKQGSITLLGVQP